MNMYKISVPLGVCIITQQNKPASYWTVLNHYGITHTDLKKLNLSYEELYEIYKTIQRHEEIREFLKNLKVKIAMTAKNNNVS